MANDWSDVAYDEHIRDHEEEAEYEFYRAHFRQEVADELVTAVRACHELSWTEFNLEMLYARDAILRAGTDDRIVAYMRSYRAVDWYQTRLANAIAAALVDPFKAYFGEGVPARKLFQPAIQRALRDRIVDEATGSTEFREALVAFFGKHHTLRNAIFHGVLVPTLDQVKVCFVDAATLLNRIDATFNPAPIVIDTTFE
jgi:hypothetical protein